MKQDQKEKSRSRLRIVGLVILFIFVVALVLLSILMGYTVSWTGFGDFTTNSGEFVRGKTLWDWLELLVIPLSLVVGGYILNRSERDSERQRAEDRAKLEREIATDRQREATLQSYLDRMAELLLEKKLLSTKDKEIRDVARIRTLTVLRGLDAKRKRIVLFFLNEAGLIDSQKECLVDLMGADLTDMDLSGALLTHVNLRGADLSRSDFQEVVFDGCNLSDAKLISTNLKEVDFEGNIGPGLPTILFDADLSFANLTDAQVSIERLQTTKSLENAILPNGTIYT